MQAELATRNKQPLGIVICPTTEAEKAYVNSMKELGGRVEWMAGTLLVYPSTEQPVSGATPQADDDEPAPAPSVETGKFIG